MWFHVQVNPNCICKQETDNKVVAIYPTEEMDAIKEEEESIMNDVFQLPVFSSKEGNEGVPVLGFHSP